MPVSVIGKDVVAQAIAVFAGCPPDAAGQVAAALLPQPTALVADDELLAEGAAFCCSPPEGARSPGACPRGRRRWSVRGRPQRGEAGPSAADGTPADTANPSDTVTDNTPVGSALGLAPQLEHVVIVIDDLDRCPPRR